MKRRGPFMLRRRLKETEKVLRLEPEGISFDEGEPRKIGYEEIILQNGHRICMHPILGIPEECPGLYEESFARRLKGEILKGIEREIRRRIERLLSQTSREFARYMLDGTPDREYQARMDELKAQYSVLTNALAIVEGMTSPNFGHPSTAELPEEDHSRDNVGRGKKGKGE
ncbi:MAG: hypothetical protein J9259_08535 [Thermoplasmata archaeon YP2-bin.285]|uniref:Uncharacterized protein n=1 Tax=Candidatus Sysuiplasma superficiale TaxID=2823368 RepID=A0A8J7YRI9_9ARCH|nr:hypothetical protein [Candidatus Sysuiplasma superficiale]